VRYLIDVPEYTPESGVRTEWDEGSEISVRIEDNGVVILANVPGLRSLARHMLVLAQDSIPTGNHIHMDDWSGLSSGSISVTIERR
jgi:hypothetical protein